MNSKKIIALICAAAMTAAAFTSITAFADGEDTGVELTTTKTFDFETTDGTIGVEDDKIKNDMTAEVVTVPDAVKDLPIADETDGASLGSKVLAITGTSTDQKKYSYADIDLTSLTEGKARVKIEYDAYFSSTGRMQFAFSNDYSSSNTDQGLWAQGKNAKDSNLRIAENKWVHTVVDVTFTDGAGSVFYSVAYDDNGTLKSAGSNTIKTTLQELLKLNFTSWDPATAYIDNLKISTGGTYTIKTLDPETASTVEGSNINLVPENARATMDNTWEAAVSSTAKIANHSSAKKAQSTENNISVYDSSLPIRGNSIYAVYDVYLTPSSSVSLTAQGNDKVGTSLNLQANKYGLVTFSATHNKGDTKASAAQLTHSTWYRVVAEFPQNDNEGSTSSGNPIFTVYRINPANPSKTSGIAARIAGIGPRNLDGNAMTGISLSVTGDAYIDNQAAYLDAQAEYQAEYGDLTTSYSNGTVTVTDNSGLAKTAYALVVSYNSDKTVSSVSKEELTFASGKATFAKTLAAGDKVYVWATVDGLKPLASVYEQK